MTGLDDHLSAAVTRPTERLIEALVGPKIRQLERWAETQELTKLQDPDRLRRLLTSYLQRIATQCSYISTIVLPQEPIPIHDVYEELTLTRASRTNFGTEEDTQYAVDPTLDGMCYLVTDEAGVGKSTYAKWICLQALQNTDKIPVILECSAYDPDIDLADNIATRFDELDRSFDRDILRHLVVSGRLFIVLDGFDEAPPHCQDKLRSEISVFNDRKGMSTLLVTSRPQERLPTLLTATHLTINRLTEDQALSIIKRYDRYLNIDIGADLQKEIRRVPGRFLESPLLVSLLYRTYGFNHSIAEKISVFYSEIFDALYKGHDLTKGGFVRQKLSGLAIDDFRQLLRAFSFLHIAQQYGERETEDALVEIISKAQDLCSFASVDSRAYFYDLSVAVPLLTRDGTAYKFMHRTIAEHFAAEFVSASSDREYFVRKMIDSGVRSRFTETLEFLSELAPTLYDKEITAPIAREYLYAYGKSTLIDEYTTLTFLSNWWISYWRKADVSTQTEDGRQQIDIPGPSDAANTIAYLYFYGNHEGSDHVVAICMEHQDKHIPRSAFLSRTESIADDLDDLDLHHLSDGDIKALAEYIDRDRWYRGDEEQIITAAHENGVRNVLLGAVGFYGIRSSHGPDIRVFRDSACKAAIESVERIKEAENSISKILSPD